MEDGGHTVEAGFSFAQTGHPLPVGFQTWLEGVDEGWSSPSQERKRRWERLPGGDYRLRIRVMDAAGQSSGELTRALSVPPFLSETWYFYAGVAAVAVTLAVVVVVLWTRRLRRSKAQLEQAVGERTAELRVLNETLRQQNAKRAELVTVVSHELRSPLIGASWLADRVADAAGMTSAMQDAQRLREQLRGLRELIDGTLDLSRFELGLIPVKWQAMRWEKWVSAILDGHAEMAKSKGLAWQVWIDTRVVAEAVAGDDNRRGGGTENQNMDTELAANFLALVDVPNVSRLVHNLVGNAIKYTSSGCVEVAVRLIRPDGGRISPMVWAEWVVRDSGPGLPAEVAETLADGESQFRRVALQSGELSAPGGEQQKSSGLGLALARRLAVLAGGKIGYVPGMNGGSVFGFRIPVLLLRDAVGEDDGESVEAEPALGDPEVEVNWLPPFEGRVLVVEDEVTQKEHIREIFEPLGVFVDCAPSAAKADEFMNRAIQQGGGGYHLVVLDFNLQDETGLQLLTRWRVAQIETGLVAMVTEHTSPELQTMCVGAGCDEFLSKPLSVRAAVELLIAAGCVVEGGMNV